MFCFKSVKHNKFGEPQMSTKPWPFRLTDVRRVIEGARSAGIEIDRVELKGGTVTVFPVNSEDRLEVAEAQP